MPADHARFVQIPQLIPVPHHPEIIVVVRDHQKRDTKQSAENPAEKSSSFSSEKPNGENKRWRSQSVDPKFFKADQIPGSCFFRSEKRFIDTYLERNLRHCKQRANHSNLDNNADFPNSIFEPSLPHAHMGVCLNVRRLRGSMDRKSSHVTCVHSDCSLSDSASSSIPLCRAPFLAQLCIFDRKNIDGSAHFRLEPRLFIRAQRDYLPAFLYAISPQAKERRELISCKPSLQNWTNRLN